MLFANILKKTFMKKLLTSLLFVSVLIICTQDEMKAQTDIGNVVAISYLKMHYVENGSGAKRDSLLGIYNANVTNKNEYVLSHKEYRHFYTANSTDYMVIEEYKDLASMEKAGARNTELEEKAWPDKTKRKEFMDGMNAYFENWHGDGIFTTNTKLSKN